MLIASITLHLAGALFGLVGPSIQKLMLILYFMTLGW